ncbi:sigma 54-interacting transcriptional regulator [Deltaproteobacteria bacterium OttesenSCG-928-K17]|nr:sigma 54-interacting transcriptional regulator [Deltaproteobacteria bacterium OttesenSCG-928-K17]
MSDNAAYQKKLRKIRQAFAAGLPFDESHVRPVILESWKRSRAYGVQMGSANSELLTEEQLRRRIEQRQALCDVVFPILSKLYEFTNGAGLLTVLCDEEAYVLKTVGTRYYDIIPPQYMVREGSTRDERVVGTNGIGTALANGQPLQVRGLEHFYPTYEDYTCSGAPIFGPDGQIVGAICLAGPTENSKIHTLGLAIAIAEIISGTLTIDKNRTLLQEAYNEVNAINNRLGVIFETVASGIMLLDGDLNIVHLNSRAADLLRCRQDELAGRNIQEFFSARQVNAESIRRGFEDKYMTCETKGLALDLSVTIQPADPGGYVVNFDTATALHKKISQVAGLDAFFTFSSILGQSPAIQTSLEQARIAAQTPSNVLLTGESGTGKELFAHAIHNASDRGSGPFVAINCGALPKSLIESELFGYEGSSFTGSKKEGQPGKFELAHGGTIFLDEIGDMPFDVQSTLLRVLQSREVVRVGGTRPKKIDVRIIAATNRNLPEAINQKAFRADLFYRLNVFSIHVPALRDRPGDIRALAEFFLSKYAADAGKQLPTISESALGILESFNWPGNVRELENVLERAIYISDGFLDEQCLPDYIVQPAALDPRPPISKPRRGNAPPQLGGDLNVSAGNELDGPLTFSLRSGAMARLNSELNCAAADGLDGSAAPAVGGDGEREAVDQALNQAGGDVNRAAEILNISRRTMYRRIKKYNLASTKKFS